MRWLLFMNRVALICNICFAAMFVLNDIKNLQSHILMQILLILALSAVVFNFITILITSVVYLVGKKNKISVPLFVLNIAFFLVEYAYHFILK